MDDAAWIIVGAALMLLCGVAGYLLGRRNGGLQAEVDRLERELEAARARAEQTRAGVSEHFEHGAVLFGALARDYRAFLDHFSAGARDLGLPEGRADELLEQAVRPLLEQRSGERTEAPAVDPTPGSVQAGATPEAAPQPARAEPAQTAPGPEPDRTGPTPSTPEPGPARTESTPSTPEPEPARAEPMQTTRETEPARAEPTPSTPEPEPARAEPTPPTPEPEPEPVRAEPTPSTTEPEPARAEPMQTTREPDPDAGTRAGAPDTPEPTLLPPADELPRAPPADYTLGGDDKPGPGTAPRRPS